MFLRKIMHAIARLLIRTTQPSVGIPVQPTQSAGHANKEPTAPRGNKRSAQGSTKPRKSSPAQPRSPKKPKVAPSTKAASKGTSKKQKPVQTAKSRKAVGSSTPTPARKTRQRVK